MHNYQVWRVFRLMYAPRCQNHGALQLQGNRSSVSWDTSRLCPMYLFIWLFSHILHKIVYNKQDCKLIFQSINQVFPWAVLANYQSWGCGKGVGTNFVAKLDRSASVLGTHYSWLSSDIRAVLCTWATNLWGLMLTLGDWCQIGTQLVSTDLENQLVWGNSHILDMRILSRKSFPLPISTHFTMLLSLLIENKQKTIDIKSWKLRVFL